MHRTTRVMLDRAIEPAEQTVDVEMLMDRLESMASCQGSPVTVGMVAAVLTAAGYGKVPPPKKEEEAPEEKPAPEAEEAPEAPAAVEPSKDDVYEEEAIVEDWATVEKNKKVLVRREGKEQEGVFAGIDNSAKRLRVNIKNQMCLCEPKNVRIP